MPTTAATPSYLHTIIGTPVPHIEIMDIGAMIEGEERYRALVNQGLASVTGFEANPAEFARLSQRPGPYTYHPVCLGDGGRATLHVTYYPGCSSLLRPDETVIDAFSGIGASPPGGNFAVVKTVPVDTVRLDDIEGCARPDLVKIDVQGAELLVLENGPKTVAGALVLEAEAEFVPLYKDQPLFGDLHAFMRRHGFELHKLIDVAGRCYRPLTLGNPFAPISQVLWADAVFVRSVFVLDTYSDGDLLKAAAILNDVYRSYDLVHRLLAEFDRRAGGQTASAYTAFLNSGTAPPPLYLTQRHHG